MENPHKRMTQKSTSSPQTHFEEILRSQHLIMCCCPLPLCSPLLSPVHPPLLSYPVVQATVRDISSQKLLSLPLLCSACSADRLTGGGERVKEGEGGRGGTRAPKLRKPLVEGGRAGGEAGLEMDCAEMRMRLCFNSPALTWAQRMQRSCFHSRDPSISVWVGIVWSSLSWRGGGVCYKRVIRITGQYSGTQSAGNLK